MDPDSGRLRQLTDTPWFEWEPAWSPDGRWVAFTRRLSRKGVSQGYRKSSIIMAAADGSGERILAEEREPALLSNPTWSPDGSLVAYSRSDDLWTSEIRLVPVDGSEERAVTDTREPRTGISWSPDGTRIAFHRDDGFDGDGDQIRTLDVATGNERVLVEGLNLGEPTWSPDGSRLAFVGDFEGRPHDVYVVDADGIRLRQVTRAKQWEWNVEWSPDGQRLGYARAFGDFNTEAFVFDLVTSEEHRLTVNDRADEELEWMPDGSGLLVFRFYPGEFVLLRAGAEESLTPGLEPTDSPDWLGLPAPRPGP